MLIVILLCPPIPPKNPSLGMLTDFFCGAIVILHLENEIKC